MKEHEILAEVHRLIDEQIEALRNKNRLIDAQLEDLRGKLSASQATEIARRQEKINQLLERISNGHRVKPSDGTSATHSSSVGEGQLHRSK